MKTQSKVLRTKKIISRIVYLTIGTNLMTSKSLACSADFKIKLWDLATVAVFGLIAVTAFPVWYRLIFWFGINLLVLVDQISTDNFLVIKSIF